ncbi:atherin-like, partial [Pollicipes pollicipes]|uniref:atherin-like n=1 Tax=Pollicipes pollicipes TaxID=41117 RepID=UPI001884C8D1
MCLLGWRLRIMVGLTGDPSVDQCRPSGSAAELSQLPLFDTLDVGSCYDPLRGRARLRVTALDLWPAADTVLRGDLLSVPVGAHTATDGGRLLSLAANAWHAVCFCLLLEYLPTPALRYACCRRAARLLRPEGVLVVVSPDSAHRTANGPLYRAWRLALGTLGLVRVRYEKTLHLHCMVFRKSVHPDLVAVEALAHIRQDAARGRLTWIRPPSDPPAPAQFSPSDHNASEFCEPPPKRSSTSPESPPRALHGSPSASPEPALKGPSVPLEPPHRSPSVSPEPTHKDSSVSLEPPHRSPSASPEPTHKDSSVSLEPPHRSPSASPEPAHDCPPAAAGPGTVGGAPAVTGVKRKIGGVAGGSALGDHEDAE